jgi:hypothetical protein
MGVQRALADDVRVLRARLDADAERCARRSLDLLQAAGLYEESESFAERLVWAGSATVSWLVSLPGPAGWVARSTVAAGSVAAGLTVAADLWVADRVGGGWLSRWWQANDDVVRATFVRKFGQYSDDLVAGTSFGIGAAHPFRSGYDVSPRGAARVITGLLEPFLPVTTGTARRLASTAGASVREPGRDEPADPIPDALDRIEALYAYGDDDPDGAGAAIAIERVEHEDGNASWVVVIPGTDAGLPGLNPADALADGQSAAGDVTDYQQAILAAIEDAQIPRDEPVVLVGHSLGGMVAQQLAGSASFRREHTVGGVVTAGSPTRYPVPPEIPVLSIVNDQEVVSHTDGRSAAEDGVSPRHVLVSADLAASPDPQDQAASGDVLEAHHASTHARTFQAARNDEQVRTVADPIEALMTGTSVTTTCYETRRVLVTTPAPRTSPGPSPVPLPFPAPGTSPLLETSTPHLGTVAPLSASGPSSGRAG